MLLPKGPFHQLTGEFQYDYKRYGAVGKDWEKQLHTGNALRRSGRTS